LTSFSIVTARLVAGTAFSADNKKFLLNRSGRAEHAVYEHVARMHHEADSREDLENPLWEMLAGFRDMSVRDQADSHYALLRARLPAERIVKPIMGPNAPQFL
jgi:hypothetical protein